MSKNRENQLEGMDFLIISDQPSIKEELTKEDIRRMCLETWHDKEGKKKAISWVVEKKEFTEKDLFQNKILSSAITGERKGMIVVKVPTTDQTAREIIRQARGIDITETILADKKSVEQYQGYEIWLLEKEKVPNHLLPKN